MSDSIVINLIVEGQTEQKFVEHVLAPYWAPKGIYAYATILEKKGTNGGDVRFSRAKSQICAFLKQRKDTLVATFVDYYGLKEWPGLEVLRLKTSCTPEQIEKTLNDGAVSEVRSALPEINVPSRYIPFVAVHEFESLLFSSPERLAASLGIQKDLVIRTIAECGSPEMINNSPETAPSKRIDRWSQNHYHKTTQGITLAEEIGIDVMRAQCPNFDDWLKNVELKVTT